MCENFFCGRAIYFFNHTKEGCGGVSASPVFDLLQTCSIFGMDEYFKVFVENGCNISKPKWKEMVWNKAWDLEWVYWSIQSKSYKCLDLLSRLCHAPRYLSWWHVSDISPELIGIYIHTYTP